MNFKKTVAIATAAGALAAVSVPAMAFENEFHGMYRLRGIMSNYENATAPGGTLAQEPRTMNEFEQRARLQYIAKASDDLKLVTHFEIDSTWGDNSGGNGGRGIGGAAGADSVNIETKNVYLDFNLPSTPLHAKVGIQGFSDAYKGIYFNDDLGGVFLDANFGGVKTTAGYARLFDGTTWNATTGALNASNSTLGQKNADLYVLDGKYSLTKDLTIGASYYLYVNDLQVNTLHVHTGGVSAAAKIANINIDGFVLGQVGDSSTGRDLLAYAAQVAAKATLGSNALRAGVLYASGDDGKDPSKSNAFQTTPPGGPGSSNNLYSANMLLLMRSVYAMDTDKAMVMDTNNANQGLLFANLGFDAKLSDKLGASANVGIASAAQRNTVTASNSKYMGTELNASLDYKIFSNLTSTVQVAYVILGDYYKGTGTGVAAGDTPENPYLAGVMLNYTF